MLDNIEDNTPVENGILDFGDCKSPNIIKVLGVGGGGGNAVNHMHEYGIKDVDFIIANTDNQALEASTVPVKIQLGASLTEGLGAGNCPERGRNAALESHNDICQALQLSPDGNNGESLATKMLFVTAGMGGGTGTGAAPVISKIAKDAGILTVAIVTLPFRFEGPKRVTQAIEGLRQLAENVDSLLVVDNELVLQQYGEEAVDDAFAYADDVLTKAAKGIAEIITTRGHVNVDFADVSTVLKDSGIALMGTGVGEGENRDIKAIEAALKSPLLSNNNIKGAKNMLINVMSSKDHKLTMKELARINKYVQRAAGQRGDLIWGKSEDNTLGERLGVTLVVSGFNSSKIVNPYEGDDDKFWDDDELPSIILTSETDEIEKNAEAAPEAKKENAADPAIDEKPASCQAAAASQNAADPADSNYTTGEEVDLGEVVYDDENAEAENETKVADNNFEPLDFSKIRNLEQYDKTPAYLRKGLKLGIGHYDPNCKRITINDAGNI